MDDGVQALLVLLLNRLQVLLGESDEVEDDVEDEDTSSTRCSEGRCMCNCSVVPLRS